MRRPADLPDHLAAIWDEVAREVAEDPRELGTTTPMIAEALVAQIYRMRDARRRLAIDGEIVADARDKPVEHPAVAMEARAAKLVVDLRKQLDDSLKRRVVRR